MNKQEFQNALTEKLLPLLTQALNYLQGFLTPGWRQNQVFILIALVVGAYLLRLFTEPRMQAWLRSRDGWPKWRLRALVQVRNRLALIYFAVMAWLTYLVMQQVTWPSRSYLIGLAATLVSAWVLVGFSARLVRDRFLRRVVSWALWIYVTLYYLNLEDEVADILDSAAIELGDVRISVLTIILALALIGVLATVARVATQFLTTRIRSNPDISPSMQVLGIKVVQVVFYGLAFLIAVRTLGFDLTGFALISGAVGVGLGFGLQKVVSNLVSGVIILLDKSIKPGDVISLGDTFGWISSLTARYVSVVTRDGKEYLIPNEDLITGQVVNWSHSNEFVRLDINFGTSYSDNPHKVQALAIEAAQGVKRVLSAPRPPVCYIVNFGDSSIDYVLRFWIGDPAGGLTNIRGHVYLALWDAFEANGISIPFPQREVRILNDSVPVQTHGKPVAGAD